MIIYNFKLPNIKQKLAKEEQIASSNHKKNLSEKELISKSAVVLVNEKMISNSNSKFDNKQNFKNVVPRILNHNSKMKESKDFEQKEMIKNFIRDSYDSESNKAQGQIKINNNKINSLIAKEVYQFRKEKELKEKNYFINSPLIHDSNNFKKVDSKNNVESSLKSVNQLISSFNSISQSNSNHNSYSDSIRSNLNRNYFNTKKDNEREKLFVINNKIDFIKSNIDDINLENCNSFKIKSNKVNKNSSSNNLNQDFNLNKSDITDQINENNRLFSETGNDSENEKSKTICKNTDKYILPRKIKLNEKKQSNSLRDSLNISTKTCTKNESDSKNKSNLSTLNNITTAMNKNEAKSTDKKDANKDNIIYQRNFSFKNKNLQSLKGMKNMYNIEIVKEKVESNNKKYIVVIKNKNNPDLTRRIFKSRTNWVESPMFLATNYQLKISTSNKTLEFNLLNSKKMVNHFEYETEISNKRWLFTNFMKYCDQNEENPFNYIPLTIIMRYNSDKLNFNIQNFKNLFTSLENKSSKFKYEETPYHKLFNIECKELELVGKTSNVIIPDSHLSLSFNDSNHKSVWILKPSDLYGGKCIQLINSIEDLEKIMKKYFDGIDKSEYINDQDEESSADDEEKEDEENNKMKKKVKNVSALKYRTNIVLIQKYIEKPFLYFGRKFDIRMWVLITHLSTIYMFKEGHLKTSSFKYNESINSKAVHITNYCCQKKVEDFSKYEDGNEVSFDTFQKFLDETSNKNFKDEVYPQMIKIIKMTYESVKFKINRKKRKFCYLVLGYDFMLDENFKLWLIEVNKNSGLSISSKLIEKLVPRMMDDCVKLTVDKVFETENTDNGISRFPVEGYSDKENMWMLIS